MPTPEILKASFYPGCYYHIVCKSIDGLPLFIEPKDYPVFLERFKKFLSGFVHVWSYSLLSNHTHFILKVKSVDGVTNFIMQLPDENQTQSMNTFIKGIDKEILMDAVIERQMNSFLVSYVNYFDNKYNRKDGLFQKPFKRIRIFDEGHLQQAIVYVNSNAQKHNIVNDFKQYPYSAYLSVVQNDSGFIDAAGVLDFFGGKDQFVEVHDMQVAYFYGKGWPASKLE